MRCPKLLILVVALLWPQLAAQADWRWSNPHPHGNNIVDMVYTNGLIWQVGDRGSVYSSSDLDDWHPKYPNTRQSLRAVTFFQTRLFISGAEGTIVYCDNRDTYHILAVGTSDWLEGISGSANKLVTVGDNGAIYSSTNGIYWDRRGNFTTSLRSVAYGQGVFMAVGENGFVATSSDGDNWDERSPVTSKNLNRICYIDDKFWVVGENGVVMTNNTR